MREILFRGKRTDNGEWIKGYLYITQNNEYEISSYCKYYDCERYTYIVIPETVGQYTGLTDKNGKKIFEGDIVKTKYGRECLVAWFSSDQYNAWDLKPIGNYECKAPDKYDMWSPENLEVIGNIHDNPELLEVSE